MHCCRSQSVLRRLHMRSLSCVATQICSCPRLFMSGKQPSCLFDMCLCEQCSALSSPCVLQPVSAGHSPSKRAGEAASQPFGCLPGLRNCPGKPAVAIQGKCCSTAVLPVVKGQTVNQLTSFNWRHGSREAKLQCFGSAHLTRLLWWFSSPTLGSFPRSHPVRPGRTHLSHSLQSSVDHCGFLPDFCICVFGEHEHTAPDLCVRPDAIQRRVHGFRGRRFVVGGEGGRVEAERARRVCDVGQDGREASEQLVVLRRLQQVGQTCRCLQNETTPTLVDRNHPQENWVTVTRLTSLCRLTPQVFVHLRFWDTLYCWRSLPRIDQQSYEQQMQRRNTDPIHQFWIHGLKLSRPQFTNKFRHCSSFHQDLPGYRCASVLERRVP